MSESPGASKRPTATAEVTGILGSQGKEFADATATRNAGKGRLKKIVPWFVGVLVILALLMEWRSDEFQQKMASLPSSASTQPSQVVSNEPVVTQGTAQWEKTAEDGSIPVGAWSESTMLPPGSKTFFDAGNGKVYQIRYRLYRSDWVIHSGAGNYPLMDEIQFKALQPGLTKIPFTVKHP